MASNVRLYAIEESVARKAAAACGVMTHGSSVNAGAMENAARALGGPPLTPGAAIVTALFADLDATVREALGRLVDAWPTDGLTKAGYARSLCIHRNNLAGERATLPDCEPFILWDYGPHGFTWFTKSHRQTVKDPAAVVAAIEQVIRRVSDA